MDITIADPTKDTVVYMTISDTNNQLTNLSEVSTITFTVTGTSISKSFGRTNYASTILPLHPVWFQQDTTSGGIINPPSFTFRLTPTDLESLDYGSTYDYVLTITTNDVLHTGSLITGTFTGTFAGTGGECINYDRIDVMYPTNTIRLDSIDPMDKSVPLTATDNPDKTVRMAAIDSNRVRINAVFKPLIRLEATIDEDMTG